MASLFGFLNRLLPFATPGTPLLQDLLHLGVICAALYFAPQIQEHFRQVQDEDVQEQPPFPAAVDDHPEAEQNNAAPDMIAQEANPADDGPAPPLQPQNDDDPEPGPANPARAPQPHRNVGAKKAKALARKDQRRAYNEFQRSQGEAQRARDAEGAAEREAVQAAERERRKVAEAELEAKKTKEREKKREVERKQREEEMARREAAVEIVRRDLDERRVSNVFDVARRVGGDADDVWLEKILNAAGVLGKGQDGSFTMATSVGWVVRVRGSDMARAYALASERGKRSEDGEISHEEMGRCLEVVLKEAE